jgi:hypothetical protein
MGKGIKFRDSRSEVKTDLPLQASESVQSQIRGFISSTEVQGRLKESTKSIDNAAKIAQTLGSLMSKVASQQNARGPSDSPVESSSPRRFIQIDEIQRRASHLKDVAAEAQRSLQMHSIACGESSPEPTQRNLADNSARAVGSGSWNKDIARANNVPSSTRNNPALVASSGRQSSLFTGSSRPRSPRTKDMAVGSNKAVICTQTEIVGDEEKRNNLESQGNFEFVKDMSYTDQLILKKLRGMQYSWSDGNDDDDEGKVEEQSGSQLGAGELREFETHNRRK